MKKHSKSGLLITVALFTILTACQKNNSLVTPSSSPISGENNTTAISNSLSPEKPMPVIITEVMDFSTNPAFGTFTTTGALNTSGTVVFTYNPNHNFVTAHNVITLTTNEGTIIIHDECEFAVNQAFPFGRGSWQIVGGTGAYANIRGNGAESFPNATNDVLTGIVY